MNLRNAVAAAGVAASMLLGQTARADVAVDFQPGSLIIPTQANYQTACGTLSAYGLVYRILKANDSGHFFQQSGSIAYFGRTLSFPHPVTVYWAIDSYKKSPNRCVPTNMTDVSALPNKPTGALGTTTWDQNPWNDGCDLKFSNATSPPVANVDFTQNIPASGTFYSSAPANAIRYFPVTSGAALPVFNDIRALDDHTAGTKFTTIQYMGAPFVISAVDAPYVLALIKAGDLGDEQDDVKRFGALTQTNSSSNAAFNPPAFTDTTGAKNTRGYYNTSTGVLTQDGICPLNKSSQDVPYANKHYTFIHQATVGFHANSAKRMSKTPPRIALLDTGPGVKWTSGNEGSNFHDTDDSLNIYLQYAGLWVKGTTGHHDSAGCPTGTATGCSINGGQQGFIYDQFNAYSDLVSTSANPAGLINSKDGVGKNNYQVIWTPHWDVGGSMNYAIAPRTLTTLKDRYGMIWTFSETPTWSGGSTPTTGSAGPESLDYWHLETSPATCYHTTNSAAGTANGFTKNLDYCKIDKMANSGLTKIWVRQDTGAIVTPTGAGTPVGSPLANPPLTGAGGYFIRDPDNRFWAKVGTNEYMMVSHVSQTSGTYLRCYDEGGHTWSSSDRMESGYFIRQDNNAVSTSPPGRDGSTDYICGFNAKDAEQVPWSWIGTLSNYTNVNIRGTATAGLWSRNGEAYGVPWMATDTGTPYYSPLWGAPSSNNHSTATMSNFGQYQGTTPGNRWAKADGSTYSATASATPPKRPIQYDYDAFKHRGANVFIPLTSEIAGYSGSESDVRTNSLNNFQFFLNTRGSGLMAECASLGAFENGWADTGTGGTSIAATDIPSFMYSSGIDENDLSGFSGQPWYNNNNGQNWYNQGNRGKNCTDPDNGSGVCTFFRFPTDPFAQVGDYTLSEQTGAINDWHPTGDHTNAHSGVKRIALSWKGYNSSSDTNMAIDGFDYSDSDYPKGNDFFTFAYKDGDSSKGAIVYVGGHALTNVVAGTRIILNTLLNLGSDPISDERATASPVIYKDPITDETATIAGTYSAVTDYPPGVDQFNFSQASVWVFPYVPGNLRQFDLTGTHAILDGAQKLDQDNQWTALMNPEPGKTPADRNVFTYFGGQVAAPGTAVRNNLQQTGWVPELVRAEVLNNSVPTVLPSSTTNTNTGSFGQKCVDKQKWPVLSSNVSGTFQLGSDGICDLMQATEFTPVSSGTYITAANSVKSDFRAIQVMLQRVRGSCVSSKDSFGNPTDGSSATTFNFSPTLTQCNSDSDPNSAALGGIVDSTPAVVGPSPNVLGGTTRPTVAYVGGFDGELHAFYVGGGTGYNANTATNTLLLPNVPASCVDSNLSSANCKQYPGSTNYGATTTGMWNDTLASKVNAGTLLRGTELWAFLPATQLPLLKSNNARVDSSPVVQDVFADFTGTGKRQWHTVLVASAGAHFGQSYGHEIFAMDVTNPLHPALLWHIVGSDPSISPLYSALPVNTVTAAPSGTDPYARKWLQNVGSFQVTSCSATDGSAGCLKTNPYDYRDLGTARTVTMGQMRSGTEPVYGVFVTTDKLTNAMTATEDPNYDKSGLEVFAIDVVTGQKMWQWEQAYTRKDRWAVNGNSCSGAGCLAPTQVAPEGVSLLQTEQGVTMVYVPDLEGNVWELQPLTGVNNNLFSSTPMCSSGVACSYPVMSAKLSNGGDTYRQPITTNVSLAKLPPGIPGTNTFTALSNKTLLMVGTAGWNLNDVGTKPNGIAGQVIMTPIDGTRVTSNKTAADTYGILPQPTIIKSSNDLYYGSITVAGSVAFLGTLGDVQDSDPMKIVKDQTGKTVGISLYDLVGTNPTLTAPGVWDLGGSKYNLGHVGGLAVSNVGGKTYVVGAGLSKLTNTIIDGSSYSNQGVRAGASPNTNLTPAKHYQVKGWMQKVLNP